MKPPCGFCGGDKGKNVAYCSRSCTAKATRAAQAPSRRSQMGREARRRQLRDVRARLIARVLVGADSLEARIVLAYRFGLGASKQRNYRKRPAPMVVAGPHSGGLL